MKRVPVSSCSSTDPGLQHSQDFTLTIDYFYNKLFAVTFSMTWRERNEHYSKGKKMVCSLVGSELSQTVMSLISDLLTTRQRTKWKLVRVPTMREKQSLISPFPDMMKDRRDPCETWTEMNAIAKGPLTCFFLQLLTLTVDPT